MVTAKKSWITRKLTCYVLTELGSNYIFVHILLHHIHHVVVDVGILRCNKRSSLSNSCSFTTKGALTLLVKHWKVTALHFILITLHTSVVEARAHCFQPLFELLRLKRFFLRNSICKKIQNMCVLVCYWVKVSFLLIFCDAQCFQPILNVHKFSCRICVASYRN